MFTKTNIIALSSRILFVSVFRKRAPNTKNELNQKASLNFYLIHNY